MMIKYVLVIMITISSLLLNMWHNSENRKSNEFTKSRHTIDITSTDIAQAFTSFFQFEVAVSQLDPILIRAELGPLNEKDTNIILNLAQKIENLRLHSIDIMPGNQKNSFKLILVYAQL
ncbi:hypothetical protein OAQ47_05845 [Paracoccaceae bacterium]|nr:hypothetical protein [Paracoccaceae bacterium]